MPANEGFFEKRRRSIFEADGQPIKETQEAVVVGEKKPTPDRSFETHAKTEMKPKSAIADNQTRSPTPEEASLAFRYGSGILSFLNENSVPHKSAKPLVPEEVLQAPEHAASASMAKDDGDLKGVKDGKVNASGQGEFGMLLELRKLLTLAKVTQAHKQEIGAPASSDDEEPSRFRSLLSTICQAQIEARR